MKDFKHYLAESARSFSFIIKFAEPPTEEQMDIIESWLKRYELKDISKPALIEDDHKDFIDVPNKQVHEVKVIIGTPVSPYILLQDLKIAANISEKFMVVRNENEPIERYARFDILSRYVDKEENEDGMEHGARLGTDRLYSEAEQPLNAELYGNEYNNKLLTYLAGVAQNRPNMKKEPAAPLFSWLQLEDIAPGEPHQDTSDFNAHIKGVKPATSSADETPVSGKFMNSHGTISDDALPNVKFFKDPKTGKSKQVVLNKEKTNG
jgi:hypothetical protein